MIPFPEAMFIKHQNQTQTLYIHTYTYIQHKVLEKLFMVT